jgi:twitching motility protein PilT
VGQAPECDVESFYQGALDALRERPDVYVIGEIRDALTAAQAVALAEAGPLVIATIHAKSTELGLLKMLRLLSQTGEPVDGQARALAETLQGTICQALIPAMDNSTWFLASECMTVNKEIRCLIAERNIADVRSAMEKVGRRGGCNLMHDDLFGLYTSKKVLLEDIRKATTDPTRLDKLFANE